MPEYNLADLFAPPENPIQPNLPFQGPHLPRPVPKGTPAFMQPGGLPPEVSLPWSVETGDPRRAISHAMDYVNAARATARRYNLPEGMFLKLVSTESSWRPDVTSPAGAIGLTQLMPGTAKELGVDPNDPYQNLDGGARYLQQQYQRFGSWPLALAAYNAGPGNVDKYGGIPPFQETQNYVKAFGF